MPIFHLSPCARADVDEISAYIAEDSQEAAVRLVDRIMSTCERLSEFPLTGRLRNELLDGMRSVAVGNYVIFYDVIPDGIEVVRVLHGARDFLAIFKG